MGDLELNSRITNFLEMESRITPILNLVSSASNKHEVDLVSYCETVLKLNSRIEVDYYGGLQETTLPFEVEEETPAPLPDRKIRPPRVAR